MKRFLFVFALFIAFIAGCCSQTHPLLYEQGNKQALIKHLDNSSVVFLSKNSKKYAGYCAGVWISNNKILTARHCAERYLDNYTPENSNLDLTKLPGLVIAYKTYGQKDIDFEVGSTEKPYFATVIGYDPDSDLTLLETIDHPLHDQVIVSSQEVFDGEDIHIIGHPAGMEYTYLPGIISNTSRQIEVLGQDWHMMQISAPLFGGNSGGGIFDVNGNLISIVSCMRTNVPNVGYVVHRNEMLQFLKNENAI